MWCRSHPLGVTLLVRHLFRAVLSGRAPGTAPARSVVLRAGPSPAPYLTVTVAPAPSRAALALSAVSLLALSRTGCGALSTRSLASLRPRLVSDRTSLMTWIFLSPAASR